MPTLSKRPVSALKNTTKPQTETQVKAADFTLSVKAVKKSELLQGAGVRAGGAAGGAVRPGSIRLRVQLELMKCSTVLTTN